MKRDMNLARKILFAIEASRDDTQASIRLPVDDYDTLHISHHIQLLKEGGLIHAIESTHTLNASTSWKPHSLTWKGHDFLNLIRDDATWEAIKDEEARLGGDLPSDLIAETAQSIMRKRLTSPAKPT
ncbi:DUF2513 domain-containing protein [Zhengella mangrovi]|nr:DUF2513 domain-containing protein [Zhengella mangrovi]